MSDDRKAREILTLAEGKQYLRANFTKGVLCPCCNQMVKLYVRKLNSGMASTLIRIYKEYMRHGKPVMVKDFLRANKFKNNHDWTLLVHWGLLAEVVDTPNSKQKSSGMYVMTQQGHEFVVHGRQVPSHVKIYNNVLRV